MELAFGILAFLMSAIGTGVARFVALKAGILDIPNSRSSHVIPTPRGGGVAIALVTLIVILWRSQIGDLPGWPVISLLIGGGIVAFIGAIDDRYGLNAVIRLIVQFVAASIVVFDVDLVAEIPLPAEVLNVSWLGSIIALIGIVWLINVYNFMDGIDGLAGTEAATVAVGASLVFAGVGSTGTAILCIYIFFAATGFLLWNWPPAKVFLGDVGSNFLGFLFGTLALITVANSTTTIWVWLILLAVFLIDATITLLRRLIRGEPVLEAHKSHAYQHAATILGSHKVVTIAVGLINLFWLTPIALVAAFFPDWGIAAAIVAWLPLAGLAVYLGAGKNASQPAQKNAV